MRRISQIDALAECTYCSSQRTRRKPVAFSHPGFLEARPGPERDERINDNTSSGSVDAHCTDCYFENKLGSAVELHGGTNVFTRTGFKGNKGGIVLKGNAKAYTENCEFR